MTKFIEHISSNIIEIASNNSDQNTNNFQENLNNTIDDISTFMQKLGINDNIIKHVSDALREKFNDLLDNGVLPKEAYFQTFESVSNILSLSISNESSIEGLKDEESQYDLNFASSTVNDKSLLIDDAMSQGMTVEEAIQYVNSQVNQSNSEVFGPPSFADSENINSNNQLITKSEDEINLDKIEADMDEQANKMNRDNSLDTEQSSSKEILVDTKKENLEEDDMS